MVPEKDRERIVLHWNGSQNCAVPWAERTQLKNSQSLLDDTAKTSREVRTRRASLGEAARVLAQLVRFASCRQPGRAKKRSERAKTREIPVDDTGAAFGLRTNAEDASHIRRHKRLSALRAENLRSMQFHILAEETLKNGIRARCVNRLHTTAPHHSLDSYHVI